MKSNCVLGATALFTLAHASTAEAAPVPDICQEPGYYCAITDFGIVIGDTKERHSRQRHKTESPLKIADRMQRTVHRVFRE